MEKQFTEEEVMSGMVETVVGRKKVDIPGLGELEIRQPTQDDELEADAERSKSFTRFLLEGLKTEQEMKEIAEERGLWKKTHEKELEDIQREMGSLRAKLRSQKENSVKAKSIKKELIDAREKFLELVGRKNSIFSHTVEAKATSVYWQFLVFRCTYKENGERQWFSFKKFSEEIKNGPVMELLSQFISFYNGLTDDFFDLWREEETELQKSGE